MHKYLLTIICTVSAYAMAKPYSSEYASLIREDRVWEYIYVQYYTYGNIVQFRFDGTEEINGKEYHLLKATKQMEYNAADPFNIRETTEVTPSWPVAYLREENGKVYRTFPEGFPDSPVIDSDREYLVMDFTLGKDEKADMLIAEWHGSGECFPFASVFTAGDIFGVTVAGEECRVTDCAAIEMQTAGDDPIEEDWTGAIVEGIGPTNDCPGTLAALVGNYPMNQTPPFLNNVYDLEGNVIFEGEGIKVPATSYVPLIREDRVWEYTVSDGMKGWYSYIYQYAFEGTRMAEGNEYHVFKPVRGWIWNKSDSPDTAVRIPDDEISSSRWATEFLIREEEGRMYTYVNDPYADDIWNANGAALSFDFNLTAGQTAQVLSGWQGEHYVSAIDETLIHVTDTGSVCIDGEECPCYDFLPGFSDLTKPLDSQYLFRAIAGIGAVQVNGDPANDTTGTMAFYENPNNPPLNGTPGFSLSRVYNADGEVIYNCEGAPLPPTSVAVNMAESRRPVYDGVCVTAAGHLAVSDMQGRVVAVAEGDGAKVTTAGWTPGIYVAVATDSAGRTSTEKFVVK